MNLTPTPRDHGLAIREHAGRRFTGVIAAALIGTLWSLASASAAATTVYRCGNEYRQTPCEQGQALTVKDRVRDEDRRAAQSRIDSTQAVADSLRAERLQREAEQQRALEKELKAQQSAERAQALQQAKAQREAEAQALARSRALDRAAKPPRKPIDPKDEAAPAAPPAKSWGNAPTR